MANALIPAPQSSLSPAQERAMELIAEGVPANKVALKMAKGDKKAAHAWRRWLKRNRFRMADFSAEEAQLEAIIAVPAATRALVRRAKRGRVDAVKLLFEVTGFHNTKVKHEHSGEIEIKMTGLARPRPVETVDNVVDAEVVEED